MGAFAVQTSVQSHVSAVAYQRRPRRRGFQGRYDVKHWLAVPVTFLFSCAAQAFLPPYEATVAVGPWVPTPQQHVVITVTDSFSGGLNGGSDFTDVLVTVNGNVISVFGEFPTIGNGAGIATRQLDIGALPAGRYTVNYSSNAPDVTTNPAFHKATMSFSVAEGGLTTVVEFYNAARDHYFITANAAEIDLLDRGVMPGWVRTGETFKVMFGETAQSSAKTVCRFYGLPSAGLDSHFFSASMSECIDVINRWPTQWLLETTDAFSVVTWAPVFGCHGASEPLYRLYNNRPDVNHRYTTSTATRDVMIAKGWISEGTDVPAIRGVTMCVPT